MKSEEGLAQGMKKATKRRKRERERVGGRWKRGNCHVRGLNRFKFYLANAEQEEQACRPGKEREREMRASNALDAAI